MTAELTNLSNLHVAYEEAADPDDGNYPGSAEAAELSAAVGEFLDARDYLTIGDYRTPPLSLRDRLALVLSDYDPNGLQPATGELDVIMAVIASVEQTNAEWQETDSQPTTWRYAIDAERSLNARRKADWTDA